MLSYNDKVPLVMGAMQMPILAVTAALVEQHMVAGAT